MALTTRRIFRRPAWLRLEFWIAEDPHDSLTSLDLLERHGSRGARHLAPTETPKCSDVLSDWHSDDLAKLAAYVPATSENTGLLMKLDDQLEQATLRSESDAEAFQDALTETVDRIAGDVEGLYWRAQVCGLPEPTHDDVFIALHTAASAA